MKQLSLVLLVLLVGACAALPPSTPHEADSEPIMSRVSILAMLSYRERIALPADARLVVQITRVDAGGHQLIAQFNQDLDGRQVPIPVDFSFEHETSIGSAPLLELRARILYGEDLLRDTGPLLLRSDQQTDDLGTVPLYSTAQLADSHGRAAAWPAARAGGNEPGWQLRHDAEKRLTLLREYGQLQDALELVHHWQEDDRFYLYARGADTGILASYEPRICRDTATGMPSPWQVTLQALDGPRLLHGCGGEPASLLQAHPWRIQELDGQAVPDEIHMTLVFGEDGRLSGKSACNSYFASVRLTGENLQLEQPGATLMACSDERMELEQRFFELLAEVRHFDIDDAGRLLLEDEERSLLIATVATD